MCVEVEEKKWAVDAIQPMEAKSKPSMRQGNYIDTKAFKSVPSNEGTFVHVLICSSIFSERQNNVFRYCVIGM